MAGIQDIVSISISIQSDRVSRAAFGTILVVGCAASFSERLRYYTKAADLLADGFSVFDPEYKAAVAIFSQDPAPPRIAVGRRANLPTMKAILTPNVANNTVYAIMIDGRTYSITSGGTATAADIVDALVTAINTTAWVTATAYSVGQIRSKGGKLYEVIATTGDNKSGATGPSGKTTAITDGNVTWKYVGAEVTASNVTNTLQLVVPQGAWFEHSFDTALFSNVTSHADAGLGADLDNIALYDGGFYGVISTHKSTAEIAALATWVESNGRISVVSTNQTDVVTTAASGATDIAATLKGLTRMRTLVAYHPLNGQFFDAAWMGLQFTKDAGSENWAFKTLSGISPVALTPTQETNLFAKNANTCQTIAGINVTRDGKVAGNEWIDVIRGRDALKARIQEDVYAALTSTEKIPFTDPGGTVVGNIVQASLAAFEKIGFLAEKSTSVSVPPVSSVSSANKAARRLPAVKFKGTLAGAINAMDINGTVSV